MIVFFGDELSFAEKLSRAQVPVDHIEVRFSPSWANRSALQIAHALTDGGPSVVVIGPTIGGIDPIPVMAAINEHAPGVSTVLCSASFSGQTVLRAMRAGARDVVPVDIADAELHDCITRALSTSERLRERTFVDEEIAEDETTVISVISPKGGVGRTMLATNLAVGLAHRHPGQVVLVDLDVQFGDVSSVLGLAAKKTLSDLAEVAADGVDPTELKTFLTPHGSELYVIPGTESLVEAESIDPTVVKEILVGLAEEFSFVVIDTSAAITDFTLAALEASTDALLVSSTDVPGVRGLRRMLDALDAIGMVDQRRHLVINRSTDRYGVSIEHVEEAAGMQASIAIPAVKEVAVAMNQGIPVVDLQGRNPLIRALEPMFDQFQTQKPEAERGRPFWKWGSK